MLTMEQKLEKLTDNMNEIKTLIQLFNNTLLNIENRLSRLEQMDSIEHRVAVNQIDLSDIKDSLVRIEETQSDVLEDLRKKQAGNEEIQYINRRLDSHLVKLAKAEEEIIIIKNK